MADTMRWRYGDTNPVVMPVDASTVIEIGDLIFVDANLAMPASMQLDQETEAGNQELFHMHFAGVAMQRSRSGDLTPIRVATTGVFEFDCPANTFQLGDLMGPNANAGNNGLENQRVDKVLGPALAIGRCARRVPVADTRVLVDIISTLMYSGPQQIAVAP